MIVTTGFITPPADHFDCHSPTAVEVKEGHLMAAWFGGPGEGKCDFPGMRKNVGIFVSHFEKGCWSKPEEAVSCPSNKCWNPVLHKTPDGELILFYKIGKDPRSWVGALKRSSDAGKTWSKEELLPEGILGPIKNKPLIGPNGELICGSSVEEEGATSCWIEIFHDNSWKKYGPIAIPNQPFGALQPTLYFGEKRELHLLCRDRALKAGSTTGTIWHAVSKDLGKTFTPLKSTQLPNPDSGIDAVKTKSGLLILIYNPSHVYRSPLSVAVSKDDGNHHFETLCDLEKDARAEYPSVIELSDGSFFCVYSYSEKGQNQRRIKYQQCRLND